MHKQVVAEIFFVRKVIRQVKLERPFTTRCPGKHETMADVYWIPCLMFIQSNGNLFQI